MSLDFSQIKEISIPEGKVTEIKSNNQTIWINAPSISGTIQFLRSGYYYLTIGLASSKSASGRTYKTTISQSLVTNISDSENKITISASGGATFRKTDSLTLGGAYNNTNGVDTVSGLYTANLSGRGTIRIKGRICMTDASATSVYIDRQDSANTSVDIKVTNNNIESIKVNGIVPYDSRYPYLTIAPSSIEIVE